MTKKNEQRVPLHHYQHVDDEGVTYTYDAYRVARTDTDTVTYEIKNVSARQRPPVCGIGRHESDSYTEVFQDTTQLNARFLEIIGQFVK